MNHHIVAGEREVLTEGKMLLVACEAGSLQGYGLHSRCKVFETSFDSPVNCCAFLSSTLVACGTDDSSLAFLDLRNTRYCHFNYYK